LVARHLAIRRHSFDYETIHEHEEPLLPESETNVFSSNKGTSLPTLSAKESFQPPPVPLSIATPCASTRPVVVFKQLLRGCTSLKISIGLASWPQQQTAAKKL
jgi:hypothetical protein